MNLLQKSVETYQLHFVEIVHVEDCWKENENLFLLHALKYSYRIKRNKGDQYQLRIFNEKIYFDFQY